MLYGREFYPIFFSICFPSGRHSYPLFLRSWLVLYCSSNGQWNSYRTFSLTLIQHIWGLALWWEKHTSEIFVTSSKSNGQSFSAVAEFTPHDQEIMASTPARCKAFSSSFSSHFPSTMECPQGGASLSLMAKVDSCLCCLAGQSCSM